MNTQNERILRLLAEACGSGMMDAQRLINLGHLLMSVDTVRGAACEFGCNKGYTAAYLDALTLKKFWLYDSFKGLPRRSEFDIASARFVEGAFKCARADCENKFAHLPEDERPHIVEGLVENVVGQIPGLIAFAHIDLDFYHGTKAALQWVYPVLAHRGVCVIDDYSWPGLPGVKLAVDSFMKDKNETLVHPLMLGHDLHRAHQAWFVKL